MKVISCRAIFPAPAVLATHNAAQQSSFSSTFVGSFDLELDKISLYLVWFLSKHCFCSFVGSLLKRFHLDKCRIRIVYLVCYFTSRMEMCLENWKRPLCLCASVPHHLDRQICGKRSSHWSEWTNQKPFLSGQLCEFTFIVSDPDICHSVEWTWCPSSCQLQTQNRRDTSKKQTQ